MGRADPATVLDRATLATPASPSAGVALSQLSCCQPAAAPSTLMSAPAEDKRLLCW